MRNSPILWLVCSAVSASFVLTSICHAADPVADTSTPVPEYRFVVGQELVYRETGQKTYGDRPGFFIETAIWHFFVIDQTTDDSWKVMVRRRRRFQRVEKDLDAAKVALAAELDDPDDPTSMRAYALFNIDKHGRVQGLSRRDGIFIPVTRLFLRLPSTISEAEQGWNYDDASREETIVSRLSTATSSEELTIHSIPRSLENEINRVDEKIRAAIDRNRNLVRRVNVNTSQTYNGKDINTSELRTELIEVKSHDEQSTRRFAKEAADCDALIKAYDAIWNSRDRSPEELERQLTERIEKFAVVVDSLQTAELKSTMRETLALWKKELKFPIAEAKERVETIGKLSPNWKTTDITGRDFALEDFKGKVVILDFWFRGCGWCAISMPQARRIAEYFKDQPVAFLNMNHNDELADIQLVIDKAKLDSPVLKAGAISELYKIDGFPTLLVLDQQGTIRDVHFGYSPSLANDVIRSVELLLKTKS